MEKEQKFVELAKKYETMSEELSKVRDELTAAMLEVGVDQYVQDSETMAVYKVIKPSGTFIFYKEVDYKRTAMNGERGGTVLSKKEAEEKGFVLSK